MLFIGSLDHPGKILTVINANTFDFSWPNAAIESGKAFIPVQNASEALDEIEYLKAKHNQPEARLCLLRFKLSGSPITRAVYDDSEAAADMLTPDPAIEAAARVKREKRVENSQYVEATGARLEQEDVAPHMYGVKLPFITEVMVTIGAIFASAVKTGKND